MNRPYIAKMLARKGKCTLMPMPYKYREALDVVKRLDIIVASDEDDMEIIGYESLYLPTPRIFVDTPSEIERVAGKVSKLSEEQVRVLGNLCKAFNLVFSDIESLLNLIIPEVYVYEVD